MLHSVRMPQAMNPCDENEALFICKHLDKRRQQNCKRIAIKNLHCWQLRCNREPLPPLSLTCGAAF